MAARTRRVCLLLWIVQSSSTAVGIDVQTSTIYGFAVTPGDEARGVVWTLIPEPSSAAIALLMATSALTRRPRKRTDLVGVIRR